MTAENTANASETGINSSATATGIASNTIDVDNDSSMTPDYINFNKSKKPVPEKPKKNQEGLIPEEEY